jgi:hypothetical protein
MQQQQQALNPKQPQQLTHEQQLQAQQYAVSFSFP